MIAIYHKLSNLSAISRREENKAHLDVMMIMAPLYSTNTQNWVLHSISSLNQQYRDRYISPLKLIILNPRKPAFGLNIEL